MTSYSIPFLITTVTYFILGMWVLLRYQTREQRLYGYLCFATAFWQGIWVTLLNQHAYPSDWIDSFSRALFSFVIFTPIVLHHFIDAFVSGRRATEQSTTFYWILYAVGGVFAGLVWFGDTIYGPFDIFPWGYSFQAGKIHPLFCAVTIFLLGRVFYLLYSIRAAVQKESGLHYQQWKWLLIATLVYSLGSFDFLSNYGFALFPPSFLTTGVSFFLFTYVIFRYNVLDSVTLRESEVDRKRQQAASDAMLRMGMTTAFPLVSQGELLGYLLLGEKMSEESYSKEDMLLIRIVANQAALAYQRVRYLELAVKGARTEMLGAIAGGFAHEIRTPLANIRLPAELCFMDLVDIELGKKSFKELLPDLKSRLNDIMGQTSKANEKIEAIRLFSKPGQAKLEPTELLPVIEGSLSVLAHLIQKWNIQVHFTKPSESYSIRANNKQLEIVFVNLFKNAIEAMSLEKPEAFSRDLKIHVHEQDGWVRVHIKDSGPGIKRTDIGHLFDAYFTTKGSSGTGIGLFLSQQVIKAHGGFIDVQSEEGQGTEFIIRLPKIVVDTKSNLIQAA